MTDMKDTELIQKIKAEIDKLYGEYKDKFHQCGDQYHLGLIDGLDMAERILDTLESEKPVPADLEEVAEWSEEDEEMLDATIDIVSGSFYEPLCPRKEMLAWLKHLRPHWKPSEEQMKALQCSIAFMEIRKSSDYDISPLKSLYEQLKKLM